MNKSITVSHDEKLKIAPIMMNEMDLLLLLFMKINLASRQAIDPSNAFFFNEMGNVWW